MHGPSYKQMQAQLHAKPFTCEGRKESRNERRERERRRSKGHLSALNSNIHHFLLDYSKDSHLSIKEPRKDKTIPSYEKEKEKSKRKKEDNHFPIGPGFKLNKEEILFL